MKQSLNQPKASWASNTTDDLSALSQLMSLPELAYQDIGQQQQLAQIMARWPLLDELRFAQHPSSAQDLTHSLNQGLNQGLNQSLDQASAMDEPR